MRLKRIIAFLLSAIFLVGTLTTGVVTPVAAAGKEEVKRSIAIVYDNSGSMFTEDNKSWCQALYAVQVFAMMMNPGDRLLLYPMNNLGPVGEEAVYKYNTKPLIITTDEQKKTINKLQTDFYKSGKRIDGTPSGSIDKANDGLLKETADEKWLVVLTDGERFDNQSNTDTKALLETKFEKCIANTNILYLGIGVDKELIPSVKTSQGQIYEGKAVTSDQILSVLTEMCNMIFGRDSLPNNHVGQSSVDFDIPLSKLYVFIQGDGISDVVVKKDDKTITPSQTFEPTYCTVKDGLKANDTYFKYVADENLKGYIAVYENLEKGEYTYSYSGKASSTAFYYEVDADLELRLKNSNGDEISDASQITPGDYYVEYALVDKNGNILESDLLGNVDFNLEYSINGASSTFKSKKFTDQFKIPLDALTEFSVDFAEIQFLSGYKIRKSGRDLGFFSSSIKGLKGESKTLDIELTGGQTEVDADLVNTLPSYFATLTYDNKTLTGDDLKNVQFTAEISGRGIVCTFEPTDTGYEIILRSEEGLIVVPVGAYTLSVSATVSSELYSDSTASDSTILTVNEVKDKLTVELSYFGTTYSTVEKKSPEITATVKYNGEKLTDDQFSNLELTAQADGMQLNVVPDYNKNVYTITINTDVEVEKGEYPIKISATGIYDRSGNMLSTSDSVDITVQLLPQWLVILIWMIAILILILLIVMWLRTPVLPKKIRITNVKIRVGGKEMGVLKANVTYSGKGRKRVIKVKGTGDLSDARWSATLIPAKDSYRYLASKRRKAMVVNGTVTASNNVNIIDFGSESYSRNKKDNKLYRDGDSTRNFKFRRGNISYSGIKVINGKPTKYSISGDIRFE